DGHAEGGAPVRLEQSSLIPERVPIGIVFQYGIVIAPAQASDFGNPLSRDPEQMGGAVRRIMHRREAVTPSAFPALEKERLETRVVVLALAGIDPPECAFLLELARRYRQLLVIAGLSHHVSQPASLHRLQQLLALVQRH